MLLGPRSSISFDSSRSSFVNCATVKSVPVEVYFTRPSTTAGSYQRVQMAELPQSGHANARKVPVMIGDPPLVDVSPAWEGIQLEDENLMRTTLTDCLSRLVFYRGVLTLRTLFGHGWFDNYPYHGATSLDEFTKRLHSPVTAAQFGQM